ncbi:hypothetical protein INR49_027316 [Caranx melampygus]|nr:hypothetical protein INR49_027316 [Caranx melampygus]
MIYHIKIASWIVGQHGLLLKQELKFCSLMNMLLLRTLGGSDETLLAGSGVDALVLVLCVSLVEPHVDGWFTVGSGCCLAVRSERCAPVGHMHF